MARSSPRRRFRRKSGTVNVKTEIRNDSAVEKNCALQTDILDPDGKTVATISSTQTVAAGTTVTFDQTTAPVAKPKLWHPDHPFLYTAVSKVLDGGKIADNFETPFGFRWFKWTADQGFFLNGEHLYFKGADVHQDHAGWGDAVADSGFYRDVKLVKEAGFQFIRGSHYPHAPAFADACDQLGVLFWSENCFWGMGGRSPDGYWNASAYPTNAEDDAAFEAKREGQLARHDPHQPQPSVHRRVEHVQRGFLQRQIRAAQGQDFSDGTRRAHASNSIPRGRRASAAASAATLTSSATSPATTATARGCSSIPAFRISSPNTVPSAPIVPAITSRAGEILCKGRATRRSRISGAIRGAAARCFGACLTTAASPATRGAMGIVDYFRLPKRAWYWYRNEYAHIPPPEWPVGGTPAALQTFRRQNHAEIRRRNGRRANHRDRRGRGRQGVEQFAAGHADD